jgi:DMSO reductase anchor subunit
MLLHSAIIGIIFYFFMTFVGQQTTVAENRSILIAACVLIYMIVFGHGLPLKINKNI